MNVMMRAINWVLRRDADKRDHEHIQTIRSYRAEFDAEKRASDRAIRAIDAAQKRECEPINFLEDRLRGRLGHEH